MKSLQELLTKLLHNNRALVSAAQISFIGIMAIAQLLLFAVGKSDNTYATIQFSNFLTNVYGLILSSAIPIVYAVAIKDLSEEEFVKVRNNWFTKYVGLILIQALILYILTNIYYFNQTTVSQYVILLSVGQNITFSILNFFFMELVGRQKFKQFFIYYSSYAFIKALIFFNGGYFLGVVGAISGIILVNIIFVIIYSILTKKKLDNIKAPNIEAGRIIDQIMIQILMFLALHLIIAQGYVKAPNSSLYSVLSLVVPFALFPYYIISSQANVVLVKLGKEKINLKKEFTIAALATLLLIVFSFTAMNIILYVIRKDALTTSISLYWLLSPISVFLSIISIGVALLQREGKLRAIRSYVLPITAITFIAGYLIPSIDYLIYFLILIYAIISGIIIFVIKKEYK